MADKGGEDFGKGEPTEMGQKRFQLRPKIKRMPQNRQAPAEKASTDKNFAVLWIRNEESANSSKDLEHYANCYERIKLIKPNVWVSIHSVLARFCVGLILGTVLPILINPLHAAFGPSWPTILLFAHRHCQNCCGSVIWFPHAHLPLKSKRIYSFPGRANHTH